MVRWSCRLMFLLTVSLVLAACGSNANLVMNDVKKRDPLPMDAEVIWLKGAMVPVVPENAEFVATIENNMDTQCTLDDIVPFYNERAREIGANLIFVKQNVKKKHIKSTYSGNMVIMHSIVCDAVLVDFYFLPREAK